MNTRIEKYGVKAVKRPKVKATKILNLSGNDGRLIVRKETEATLKNHKKTFTKLSTM
jgi:hypothetical protein